jgi:predicted MFS family arabinose efflux permease
MPPNNSTRQAAWLVAFMWGAYFLNYCDRQTIFAMFPVLKSDLGMSDTELGLTGSFFLWVYGLGCPISGQLGDRISKRLLVLLSLAVWSAVTVATGFAGSIAVMLGLRAAMGISESLFMPSAIALTAGAYPPAKRSRAVSILTTAQIAGTVGGGWFGGWMAQHGHWRGAFFVLGAVGLVYAVPYFTFLRRVEETPLAETRKTSATLAVAELAKVPTYLILCVLFPAFVFGLWLIYGWLPDFLHEKFSLDLTDAAFNATVFLQGATFLGILAGGYLADRLYFRTKAARLWLLTASLVFCAPCLHALGSSATLPATRAAAAGFGLFSGLWMGNIFPAAFEVVPADARASAVGILNFFGSLMSGFALLGGGLWKRSLGIDGLFTSAAVIYFAGALLLLAGIKWCFARDYARIH